MTIKKFTPVLLIHFLFSSLIFFSGCHKKETGPRKYTVLDYDFTAAPYAAKKKRNRMASSEVLPAPVQPNAQKTVAPQPQPPALSTPTPVVTPPVTQSAAPATSVEQAQPNNEPELAKNVPVDVKPKAKKEKKIKKTQNESLDFEVHNTTGKTIYLSCFTYIKTHTEGRWGWVKSKSSPDSTVYKLEDDEKAMIQVPPVADPYERKHVFGYLGTFKTEQEAEDSIYELLDDHYKVDLDLLYKLKGKTVILGVESYGFKGQTLDYEFAPRQPDKQDLSKELDFTVENRTGKPVWVTCFVYEYTGDTPVWRFEKTPVQYLEDGQQTIIDVRTIKNSYERTYLRGYLAVFDEDEKDKAEESTYELLEAGNKVKLGPLFILKDKKIVLDIAKYGVEGDIVDYTTKPIRHIQFGQKKNEQEKPEEARLKAWR